MGSVLNSGAKNCKKKERKKIQVTYLVQSYSLKQPLHSWDNMCIRLMGQKMVGPTEKECQLSRHNTAHGQRPQQWYSEGQKKNQSDPPHPAPTSHSPGKSSRPGRQRSFHKKCWENREREGALLKDLSSAGKKRYCQFRTKMLQSQWERRDSGGSGLKRGKVSIGSS